MIETMIRQGERRRLLIANKAISAYQRARAERFLMAHLKNRAGAPTASACWCTAATPQGTHRSFVPNADHGRRRTVKKTIAAFSRFLEQAALPRVTCLEPELMDDERNIPQLATAMVAIVFAAVILGSGGNCSSNTAPRRIR